MVKGKPLVRQGGRTLQGKIGNEDVEGLGTAATKDVGESNGNVMEVGAFGIGKALNYNPDITLEEQHINGLGSASHGNRVPLDGPDLYIGKVLYVGDAEWGTQLWFSYNEGKAWFRNKNTGKSYEPWKEFIHTGNIRTALGYSIYPVSQKLVTEQLATKASTSHTHPHTQVTGLGTAATRDVGTGSGNVMQVGAFGYGGQNPNNLTLNCNDLPPGSRNSWSDTITESTAVSLNLPALGGSPSAPRSWHVECFGRGSTRLVQEATEVFGVGTAKGRTFTRVRHDTTWHPWQELIHTGNILTTTGQSTLYPMTQKATTDAINARGFADASGVLTVTSGALSNDMSSFLSQTTKASMRSNLEVPQLNASATQQGGLKARLEGTTLYLTNDGTNP